MVELVLAISFGAEDANPAGGWAWSASGGRRPHLAPKIVIGKDSGD
jgi:hypothetical protein